MRRVLVAIDKLSLDGRNPSCVTQHIRDTHAAFAAAGYAVTVCDFRPAEEAGRCLAAQGIAVDYLPHGRYSPALLPALLRVIDRRQPDIVHCHGYNAANFARLARTRRPIRTVVHEHAVLRVRPHQYLADRLLRRRTDAAIAVSEAVKAFMVHGRSVPPERVHVVYNGIAVERFRRAEEGARAAARRRFGVPDGQAVVGTVTRLREEKGNRVLVEAAARICRHRPDTVFLIVGDGPLRGELEAQAARLGVADKVIFCGFVPDVVDVLSCFDVAVVPSLSEGFSFAAVEAMANGRPVVASRVGGLCEIICNGVNGLHVPPGDAEALTAAILRVLADPALAQALSRGAQAAADTYAIAHYVRRVTAIYEALAS